MGIRQIVTDDLTGEEIDPDTKTTTVRVDGQDYDLYLSDESKDRFIALLTGEAPLLESVGSPKSYTSKTSKGGSKAKTQTHGYTYKEVKEWAIANGVKAANGNPVTEKTPRIGQSVYDAYKEAMEAK